MEEQSCVYVYLFYAPQSDGCKCFCVDGGCLERKSPHDTIYSLFCVCHVDHAVVWCIGPICDQAHVRLLKYIYYISLRQYRIQNNCSCEVTVTIGTW